MGKFIVIEGTDCSGKETQSKKIVKKLNDLGKKAIYLSFPNYETPTGKIVGGPYLGKEEISHSYFTEGAVNVDPKVASLYYAADRYYNLKEIKNYLSEDYIVILDRYVSSNQGHQAGKLKTKEERDEMYEWIYNLEYNVMGLLKPDITYFLHMPATYSFELTKNRLSLDELEKSIDHLRDAEYAYLELKDKYNFIYIPCTNSEGLRAIDEINDELFDKIVTN